MSALSPPANGKVVSAFAQNGLVFFGVFLFAGIALGNYLSGVAAGQTASLGLSTLFVVISIPPIVAGLIFWFLNRPIHRMIGDLQIKH